MRLKKFSSKVFLLALGLFLWGIGCSPSLFDDVVTTDNPATKKAPVFEDINQSEGSSTTAGNPGHGPSPTRDFHLNNLVYFPDDNDIVPVVGAAYGPFFPEGGQIVISEFALETSGEISKITSDISADMPAESDLCTEEGVVCCPVDEEFKYECYLPLVDRSLSEVFVGVMDAGFNVLSSRREPVQPNLLWLGQVPKDIQVAGTSLNNDGENQGGIGVLGDQQLLQIKEVGGQFSVLGNHNITYGQVRGLEQDAEQLAFDDAGNLGIRNLDNGIEKYTSSFIPLTGNEQFEFVDTGIVTIVPNVDRYTLLKRVQSLEGWLGVRSAKAYLNIASSGYVYPDNYNSITNPHKLRIFDMSANLGKVFKQTNAFDVTKAPTSVGTELDVAIAISQDNNGNNYLGMGYKDEWGNYQTVQSSRVVLDFDKDRFELSIIKGQSSDKGSFVVLDKLSKKVFFEEYYADITGAGGDSFSSTGTKFIFAGNSPITMAVDDSRQNISILNNDNTIHSYRVKDGNALRSLTDIKSDKNIINLNDYVTKPLLFDSNKIVFHEGDQGKYLLVGTKSLKGVLTIQISN